MEGNQQSRSLICDHMTKLSLRAKLDFLPELGLLSLPSSEAAFHPVLCVNEPPDLALSPQFADSCFSLSSYFVNLQVERLSDVSDNGKAERRIPALNRQSHMCDV